jgi:hypothetical protein
MAVAALVALAGALAGVPTHATYGARTTADEPQYLLTAVSLARDGDLDISDELTAHVWRAFHAAELPQQTRALPGGVRISPHDPLLPLVLAPGVAVGGWVGAKVTLAMLAAALAALLVAVAVTRLGVRPTVAATVTAVLSASVPLAPYGSQVYPELPAALVVSGALAALLGPLRRRRAIAVVVLACCALPWLGVKYAPVAAVLAAALVARLARHGRLCPAVLVVGALAGAGVVYLLIHQRIWSGWTVYASADHFVGTGEIGVVGTSPDHWARTTRLLGLLVERAFGIAAWQPAWLVLVPATAAALRARAPHARLLVAVLAVGWCTASYVALTMAGWWVPGRQIVVVLPAAVLLIAWWADRHQPVLVAVAVLGAVGVASWLLLAWEASSGRLTLVVDFFATSNPWYRLWRGALPDYLTPTAATWWRHGIWLAIVAGLAAAGARTARR